MAAWDRLARAGRRLLRREGDERGSPPPVESGLADAQAPPAGSEPPSPEESPAAGGLSGWIEQRAARVVSNVYESRAADLEERARRAVSSAYERSADDLEERAVRALRRAIGSEAERIKEAIEHGIAVKKREVRLSLLVLVVSSLVYLALYWLTRQPPAP